MDVLLVETRELRDDHEGVHGLVHIHRGSPYALDPAMLMGGATEEVIEETVHLGLHVTKITEGVNGLTERTKSDDRHS